MKILACAVVGLIGVGSVFAQNKVPAPSVEPFEGVWLGRVIAPNASTEIGFAFTRTPRGLGAKFAMPAMFVSGMNLGLAKIVGDTYAMPDLGIKLTCAGDTLVGTFANPLLRVELRRAGELPQVPALPPLPPAPAAAWSRALGAKIWASPVAADGIVYVGTVDGTFHAIRAADGGEVWQWPGPRPLYGEALVTGDCICFVDEDCELISLARADGALRWRVKLHDEKFATAAADKNPTFNHRTATPVAVEGTLYVGSTDHGIYALEAATGKSSGATMPARRSTRRSRCAGTSWLPVVSMAPCLCSIAARAPSPRVARSAAPSLRLRCSQAIPSSLAAATIYSTV